MRRLAPLLWMAYVLAPVPGWGFLAGSPLGSAGVLTLAAIGWLWWARRSLPVPLLIGIAVVAKAALGPFALLPRGFDARYYAAATASGPVERGIERASPGFTRVDDRLDFGPTRDRDLPVHFLNDVNRFNFYLP